jgi:hypothetical protein
LHKGILWFSQSKGEEKSVAKHAGFVSEGGSWGDAKLIEAQRICQEIPVSESLRMWGEFAIFRYRRLDVPVMHESIRRIRAKHVGVEYPAYKLLLMAADRLGAKWFGGEPNFWVGFASKDERRVCSALVAELYRPQGVTFDRETVDETDPDDLWDWVTSRPEEWDTVVSLVPDLS